MREVWATRGKEIKLGKQGEFNATCVLFDKREWVNLFGEGTFSLIHQRNGDQQPYPCAIEVEDGVVRWTVAEADVGVAGRGRVEVAYLAYDSQVKSETYTTYTAPSMMTPGTEVPEVYCSWWDDLVLKEYIIEDYASKAQSAANSAKRDADRAESAASHPNIVGENENWWIWDGAKYVDSGKPSRGAQGPVGPAYELTEADMAEIVNAVLAAMPDGDEVSY